VVKVEQPGGGDYARWYPPLLDDRSGGYGEFFASVNRGKRSVALNSSSAAGRHALAELIRQADVLVEGFRPGVMERWGLTDEVIATLNPSLVYCRITGFGQTGPDALLAGHDLGYVARAGVLGPDDTGVTPRPLSVQVADLAGGALYAAFGIAAALFRRQRTGEGTLLDVSMTEGAASLAGPAYHGRFAGRADGTEVLSGSRPCYHVYRDGSGGSWAVAALEPKFWNLVAEALQRPDWNERGLDTGLLSEVEALFASRSTSELADALKGVDACVERCLSYPQVLQDSQLLARGAVDLARGMVLAPTSRLCQRDDHVPRLGEHTRDVMRGIGWSDEQIAALE